MAFKNYTTKIDADKSAAEVATLLRQAGARAVLTEYDAKSEYVTSLSFKMVLNGQELAFKLPCDWNGVLTAMTADRQIPRHFCNREQAVRVAWRVVLDWIDAQLAFIKMKQVKTETLFVPFMIMRNGATLAENLNTNPTLLLGNNTPSHE